MKSRRVKERVNEKESEIDERKQFVEYCSVRTSDRKKAKVKNITQAHTQTQTHTQIRSKNSAMHVFV